MAWLRGMDISTSKPADNRHATRNPRDRLRSYVLFAVDELFAAPPLLHVFNLNDLAYVYPLLQAQEAILQEFESLQQRVRKILANPTSTSAGNFDGVQKDLAGLFQRSMEVQKDIDQLRGIASSPFLIPESSSLLAEEMGGRIKTGNDAAVAYLTGMSAQKQHRQDLSQRKQWLENSEEEKRAGIRRMSGRLNASMEDDHEDLEELLSSWKRSDDRLAIDESSRLHLALPENSEWTLSW